MAKKETTIKPAETVTYTKAQLLVSDRYRDKKDLVQALLDSTGIYSLEQVEEAIEKFMKGKVKSC